MYACYGLRLNPTLIKREKWILNEIVYRTYIYKKKDGMFYFFDQVIF